VIKGVMAEATAGGVSRGDIGSAWARRDDCELVAVMILGWLRAVYVMPRTTNRHRVETIEKVGFMV